MNVKAKYTNKDIVKIPDGAKFRNLTGETFGKLTVLGYAGRDDRLKEHYFWCKCECGNLTKVKSKKLTNKNGTRSCGCLSIEKALIPKNYKDITGQKFGRLNVIENAGHFKSDKRTSFALWICRCDCGNEIVVRGSSLREGNTQSCGCLNKEKREERNGENHPNWRFDLTNEERENDRKNNPSKIKAFREGVYKKDDYTCQCCKKKSGNGKRVILNAHHKNGYHWFKKGRYDIQNGITFCKECHREFHAIYGMKYNTIEQYKEFIKNKIVK